MEPCAEAGDAHLDEIAARRVLLPAFARADDLAAVGEFDQELAAEIRDDPPLQDDLLFPAPAWSSSRAAIDRTARRASPHR